MGMPRPRPSPRPNFVVSDIPPGDAEGVVEDVLPPEVEVVVVPVEAGNVFDVVAADVLCPLMGSRMIVPTGIDCQAPDEQHDWASGSQQYLIVLPPFQLWSQGIIAISPSKVLSKLSMTIVF